MTTQLCGALPIEIGKTSGDSASQKGAALNRIEAVQPSNKNSGDIAESLHGERDRRVRFRYWSGGCMNDPA